MKPRYRYNWTANKWEILFRVQLSQPIGTPIGWMNPNYMQINLRGG